MPIQSIDPIKPRPRNRSSQIRSTADIGPPPNPRDFGPRHTSKQSIDGVKQPSVKPVQIPPAKQTVLGQRLHLQTPIAQTPKKPSQRVLPEWRRALPGIIFGCGVILLILLGWQPLIGQGLIVLYTIGALLARIESRLTFGLAVAALVAVAIAQLIAMPDKADAYAIFAYLLLCAGTLSFGLETWRTKRQQSKN